MTNTSFVGQPKYLSPLNDDRVYFLASVNTSVPINGVAFIIVVCSPTYNGLGKVTEDKYPFKIKMNGKLPCRMIPADVCEYVKPLEEIDNPAIQERIKKEQDAHKEYLKNRRSKTC